MNTEFEHQRSGAQVDADESERPAAAPVSQPREDASIPNRLTSEQLRRAFPSAIEPVRIAPAYRFGIVVVSVVMVLLPVIYLGIIGARVASGQNGAAWQRRWVAHHGGDLHALVAAYRKLQDSGDPVHEWDV